MKFNKAALCAEDIKAKARALGADLVGIADGAALGASRISALDGGRVIVLAKRLNEGVARIQGWSDRHKYYNDELTLTHLEETSLELVYWLEECGYPALVVPPTHVTPSSYRGDPAEHLETMLPLPEAAVQAGLGTLGLNLQLLTPEFGPRVLLAAVLCSVEVACDRPMAQALCRGPSCGRCLQTCPADAVQHWDRDWASCDRYRSPHGFAQLTEHLMKFAEQPDPAQRKALLRSEDSFNLWQSILRGAGVVTGCRRCADVCPVGADYARMLADANEAIAENTPAKDKRLQAMAAAPEAGAYASRKALIGLLKQD